MPSVDSGLQLSPYGFATSVAYAAAPSRAVMARESVERMMRDNDVMALCAKVRQATEAVALEIARSFHFGIGTSMAVFGDMEEGVGEITFLDRAKAKEMQVTVRRDGLADVWLRGVATKQSLSGVRKEQIPFLAAIFAAMR